MGVTGSSSQNVVRRALRRWIRVVLWVWLPGAWAAPFSGVMFEDAPGLSPQSLLPAYRHALGQPLTDELAQALCRDFITLYESRGYLAPAPRVVRTLEPAGVVFVQMREPYVADVRTGGGSPQAPAFRALLEELEALRPLSRAAFDAWLARANGAGFPVQGSLVRAAAQSPAYVASLQMTERRWYGLAHLDNRGPAQLGREIAQLSLGYRSAALGYLRLDAAAAVDHDRLRYLRLSGGHRVRERGERLTWRVAASESTLPVAGTEWSVDYQRRRMELELGVPLVRRLRQRSNVTVALESYDLDQTLDDGRALRRDRIRGLRLGYDLLVATGGGRRHSLDLTLTQGLDGLGASLSPPGATPDYLLFTGRYGYIWRLHDDWVLRGDLHLQASPDTLPSSERFFIGGRRLGGAFDPATLSGDEGAGVRIAVDRALVVAGRPMTGYAYYDYGRVRSRGDSRPSDDAGSAGIGVSGSLRKLAWSLEMGVPVQTPETPTLLENDARVFFSLTQRF